MKRDSNGQPILRPTDLELLRRVLAATLPEGASPAAREAHSATLLNLFRAGITTEQGLIETMLGTADHASPRAA